MPDYSCEDCSFRKKYDNNPRSILGKIWRWHTGWCPGWKSFMRSLPEKDRINLANKYNMKKYM